MNNLSDDKEIVINEIKRNGAALKYASNRLKNDIDIANAVLESNNKYFEYLGEEIRNDANYVFKLIKKSPKLLEEFLPYLGKELKKDKEFISNIVSINHKYIKYASDILLNNKSFIIKMLKIDERCILYAGKFILSDYDFIIDNVHNQDIIEECRLINIFYQNNVICLIKNVLFYNGYNTLDKIMTFDKEKFKDLKNNPYKNVDSEFIKVKDFQQKIKEGSIKEGKIESVNIYDLYDISKKLYNILCKNSCLSIKDFMGKKESEILSMEGISKNICKEFIEWQNIIKTDIKNGVLEI